MDQAPFVRQLYAGVPCYFVCAKKELVSNIVLALLHSTRVVPVQIGDIR
jgi:hypothetical protein